VVLLHLVRHGRPLVDPDVPPREWELDPTGIADLEALRAALPTSATGAAWFSSDERKALATAQRLTDSVVQPLPALREAARSSFIDDQASFADAVCRGLQHPATAALPGWEALERTRQRVAGTVTDIASSSCRDVVLVGHGTAWTLLIHHLLDEPLPQRLPPMTMPDLLILDLSSRAVVARWGDWRTT
jgi:broad specificity phosphatase PhoE